MDFIMNTRWKKLPHEPRWSFCGPQAQMKPDIVILDIGMPNLDGLSAARQISQNDPHQKILILTITDSEKIVQEVLEAGARGFVLKSDAARDLLAAVDALEHSELFSRVALRK